MFFGRAYVARASPKARPERVSPAARCGTAAKGGARYVGRELGGSRVITPRLKVEHWAFFVPLAMNPLEKFLGIAKKLWPSRKN